MNQSENKQFVRTENECKNLDLSMLAYDKLEKNRF